MRIHADQQHCTVTVCSKGSKPLDRRSPMIIVVACAGAPTCQAALPCQDHRLYGGPRRRRPVCCPRRPGPRARRPGWSAGWVRVGRAGAVGGRGCSGYRRAPSARARSRNPPQCSFLSKRKSSSERKNIHWFSLAKARTFIIYKWVLAPIPAYYSFAAHVNKKIREIFLDCKNIQSLPLQST